MKKVLLNYLLIIASFYWFSGCSPTPIDKHGKPLYPVYPIATYDPGTINTSFDYFHPPTGSTLHMPLDAEAKDWGVERWNDYVAQMTKKAKWERHKDKFYKKGKVFLETFYADLYDPKANWQAFSEKYASHLDTVLLPLLKSTYEKRHASIGVAWEAFGWHVDEANEGQRLSIKPYKDHWFEVQMVDTDTHRVRVRIDNDRKYIINGLYNPDQNITMSPLIKVKKLFLRNFYNDMSRTDKDTFTKKYERHCTELILNAMRTDQGKYNWDLLSIGKDGMHPVMESDISYDRDGWLWVKPRWYDGPEVRVQIALVKDKLVITGLINPTK